MKNQPTPAGNSISSVINTLETSVKNQTVRTWLVMSRAELDDVYRQAKAGSIPTGDTQGTAIAGSYLFGRAIAMLVRWLAWKGKVFDMFAAESDKGVLVNKISPFGIRMVVARVYRDKSWLDGEDTIVIDYARTSLSCRKIRDEIREVQPGVYLGKVWWGKTRILDFALTTGTD
jgi:hypothetical protein